ncbi:MAG: WYL domain-containing protein [Bacteroidales bacterium]|nr:WYL domain-containing protein [Bacteroidales bacterium]
MDQPKIERVLRLMTLMSGNIEYTIDELADRLETSYRSIYRYIDTFKSCGFAVEKIHGNVYRLAKLSPKYPDLDKLVYFSEEEAYLVNRLIDRLDPTNALKTGLQRKLAAIYSSTSIADYIDKSSNASNVEGLSRAVREKKSVRLVNYESGHSGQVRDRFVEPFAFTTNYIDVWAYDQEDGRNKIFKISRMEEVEVLDGKPWEHEPEHERPGMDVFRMAGREEFRVRLRLSMKAKNLLVEEYPLAERDLTREADGTWILDTGICAVAGVGRFVSGLAGEIEILDGEPLRSYLREYAKLLLDI